MAKLTATVDGPAMCSTAEVVEQVGGIEEEWFFEGTAVARLSARGRRDRVPDRRTMGRRIVVAGAVSHPSPGGASQRPGALQRHGDRQLEQRLGR